MNEYKFLPLSDFEFYSDEEMLCRSNDFYNLMRRRRSIRTFSDKQIPIEVIQNCVKTAGTAPSGANMQPWHFVIVSDPEVKRTIRIEAEKKEHEFYTHRATKEWLEVLAPLGTDQNKSFLERAPYLIVLFEKRFEISDSGKKIKHYFGL